jgi:hypothetical protein
MSNTYFQNKVLSDMQTLIRTLRCESGGSGNCCPETNEILVNIKSNLDSVLETCVSETNQSNQLIVRPTSAQDSDLFCTLIGCSCEGSSQDEDLDYISGVVVTSGTTVGFNLTSHDGLAHNNWSLAITGSFWQHSANSIYLDGSTDAVLTARDGELSDYITVRRSNNAFLNMEIGRTIL